MTVWIIDTTHTNPKAFEVSEEGFAGLKKKFGERYKLAGGGVEKVVIKKKEAVAPVEIEEPKPDELNSEIEEYIEEEKPTRKRKNK